MVEFVCAVCVYCVEYCAGSGTVPRRERPAHTDDARAKKPKNRSKLKTPLKSDRAITRYGYRDFSGE